MAPVSTRLATISPRTKARFAGLLYLLIFIFAPSDALTVTPAKLTITLVCDVGVALLLYDLLRSVNPRLSLLAALFRLAFVLLMALNAQNYLGILSLGFLPSSPQAFNLGYGISLVPFGAHCVLVGWLIMRSTLIPKAVGALMVLAGLAYLFFLWPPLGQALFIPYIVVPAVLGEASLTLWLLIMGVRDTRSKHD